MNFLREFEKLLKEGERITREEYKKLPKRCPKCGGNLKVVKQEVRLTPKPGDRFTLVCEKCGHEVKKLIPYPDDYALFFKQIKEFIDDL